MAAAILSLQLCFLRCSRVTGNRHDSQYIINFEQTLTCSSRSWWNGIFTSHPLLGQRTSRRSHWNDWCRSISCGSPIKGHPLGHRRRTRWYAFFIAVKKDSNGSTLISLKCPLHTAHWIKTLPLISWSFAASNCFSMQHSQNKWPHFLINIGFRGIPWQIAQ